MKIAVLMSGGIDSSITAHILKSQGHDVHGVHMIIFENQEVEKVKNVAEKLQISLDIVDIREEFRKTVIDYFAKEYLSGRTPNPCYFCNRLIKFGLMLEKLGEFEKVASGHYAITENGKLFKAKDRKKDQSYFLSSLSQETLKKLIFPLGNYKKNEIYKLAEDLGFRFERESQDVCFLKGKNLKTFFEEYGIRKKPGVFIYKDGKIIGEHEGFFYYTIGQRRGLGVSFGKRVYVTGYDIKKNVVYLGDKDDVMFKYMEVGNLNYLENLPNSFRAYVKIRSNFNEIGCDVTIKNGKALVEFDEKAFAVTPGQIAVFYIGDQVVLSGVIKKGYN